MDWMEARLGQSLYLNYDVLEGVKRRGDEESGGSRKGTREGRPFCLDRMIRVG
jgi:hypothetical protein